MSTAPTPYRLVEWSPEYLDRFAELCGYLQPAVSALSARIEHVGSTAVPGMLGKPIVDLTVVLPGRDAMSLAVASLTNLGYRHRGDLGVAGREAFDRPEQLPVHHPYVVVDGSPAYHDQIDLRDYLRRTPSAMQRYAARKRELEGMLANDRTAYTEAKGDVVQELLVEARARR